MSEEGGSETSPEEIRLITRGDDMGFAHCANEAFVKVCTEGIIRTAEVVVPGPWFLEAAELLAEHTEIDVGVHLTLNCDWFNYLWRPLTHAPSLVDEDGYFTQSIKAFKAGNPKVAEVERELRAQIEMARRHIPRVSHLSSHMGTSSCTPELKELTRKLAAEYGLPAGVKGAKGVHGMWSCPAEQKRAFVLNVLENIEPGLNSFTCHPCLDTAESRAMQGDQRDASARMAVHRQVVVDVVTSAEAKEIIARRGIRLISQGEAVGSE